MKQSIKYQYYKSPAGELIIGSYDNKVCICDWRYRKMRETIDSRIQKGLDADFEEAPSEVVAETIAQLDQYFKGERNSFDLPVLFVGTDFQRSVWEALLTVPYGKTDTYMGLSEKLNNPKAIRAVASANGANAISIIVPCHRIIGSNGELVGYAGGLEAKKKLLEVESALDNKQLGLF